MTEPLGEALDHIGLQIERGLVEAELELAGLRERCAMLEDEIRSIRDTIAELNARPTVWPWTPPPKAPPEPSAPEIVAPQDPTPLAAAPIVEPRPAERVTVRDEEAGVAVSVPAPAAGAAPVPAPAPVPATASAHVAAWEEIPPEDAVEEPLEEPTRFAEYLPMLEELWAIARHDEDDASD